VTDPNPLILGRPAGPFPAFHSRFPWIGGDLQTLRNKLSWRRPDVTPFPAARLTFPMSDDSGDCLSALLNMPARDDGKPLIILIHGLTGDEDSRNIMTSAAHHLGNGHPVMRLNLRGAGPSLGKCRHHYHAGRSSDLRDVLAALPDNLTSRGVYLIGVSLGGNMLLKFLGENDCMELVRAAVAVCPPIDLKAAQHRIMAPRNAVYHTYMLRSMKQDAWSTVPHHDPAARDLFDRVRSIYDFDDLIVAPRNGFADAEDYYRRASAASFLPSIKVPTLVIAPRNDPWIPARIFLERQWPTDRAVTLIMPPDGGHVGFHAADNVIPWHDRASSLFFDLKQ